MKFIATRVEVLFSLLFLWITAGIFWPPLSYFKPADMHSLDATDPSNTIAYAMFGMFLVGVAIFRHDEMLRGLRSAWPALALVGLAYLSAF